MTGNDTIVRPTVEHVLAGKEENPESIQVQTSIAGGKEGAGVTLTTDWFVQTKTKRILFSGGWAETRVSRFPIEPLDIPDRHIREVRKVARAIFDVKRFDRIYLSDSYVGDKLTWLDSKKMSFVEERDAVLWCVLEGHDEPIGDIVSFSLTRLEDEFSPEKFRRLKKDAQKNSVRVWTKILHLILQVESGIRATETLQNLRGRGITRYDLEGLWIKSHDDDEIPVYLKKLFPFE